MGFCFGSIKKGFEQSGCARSDKAARLGVIAGSARGANPTFSAKNR